MGHFYPNLFPKNLFALFLKSAVRIFFKTLHNEYGLTQSLDHTPPPKKEPKVLKEHFFWQMTLFDTIDRQFPQNTFHMAFTFLFLKILLSN